MTTQRSHIPEAVPDDFRGSVPEFIVFNELARLRLEPNVDFIHQSRFFSPRGGSVLGSIEADFVFFNPPGLAFDINGIFTHYAQGVEQIAKDRIAQAQLAGLAIKLVFIDEDDLLGDQGRMRYVVSEGLAFRDHSRLGRGVV